jgi:hypothetical protein
MKEKKAPLRCKRGVMTINLVETPSGYSVIEGTELFNKAQTNINPNNNHVSQSQPTSIVCPPPSAIVKEQPKMTIKRKV